MERSRFPGRGVPPPPTQWGRRKNGGGFPGRVYISCHTPLRPTPSPYHPTPEKQGGGQRGMMSENNRKPPQNGPAARREPGSRFNSGRVPFMLSSFPCGVCHGTPQLRPAGAYLGSTPGRATMPHSSKHSGKLISFCVYEIRGGLWLETGPIPWASRKSPEPAHIPRGGIYRGMA